MLIIYMCISVSLGAETTQAAVNTNKVLNFQGRLLTASGAVVPDGYYNMQFKIYHGGSGSSANNPDGTLAWTESYINNGGTSGVLVRNGIFSVRLGGKNAFGSSVDWNQDTLWLSMNVAGTATACTSFGSSPCTADGEMLPMSRIASVPNAINSSAVGGKTADQLLQLAQGVQVDASNNTSSIFINKTGTGNLLQFQNSATDIFSITNFGDIVFGSNGDKIISIATAANDQDGNNLTLSAGGGGDGGGTAGGDLVLQGGDGGGTDGNAGGVQIDTGAVAGDGLRGSIAIGEANAGTISVGSQSAAIEQTILIGTNDTAGSTTDVTVGSGANATGGSTTIQAKDGVTIATNGTNRAVFSGTTNVVYFGNGVAAAQPDDFTIQGTASTATAVAGGSLTMQGGNASTGNANGGNVILAGGTGSGTGSTGLVVLGTPTFSTIANDASCFTGGLLVADSCTISEASVNNAAAVIVGFSNVGKIATLPDPKIKTPGRVYYVMASSTSKAFSLAINGGGGGNTIPVLGGATVSLIWNGSDWSIINGSGGATLQDAYDKSPQTAGGAELVLNTAVGTNGLVLRDGGNNPQNDTLLTVKDSSSKSLISVNNRYIVTGSDLATDGGVNDAGNFSENWQAVGDASIARLTNDGQAGNNSVEVAAGTSADSGVSHKLMGGNIIPGKEYRVSFYAKLTAGSTIDDLEVSFQHGEFLEEGFTITGSVDCSDYTTQTVVAGEWTQISCTFLELEYYDYSNSSLLITQPTSASEARTFLIDSLSFVVAMKDEAANVKIGSDSGGDDTTLFTLDKNYGVPDMYIFDDEIHEAVLGSMYYDTSLGVVQCYEADGWGDCGARPDSFITLSPEYADGVTHGEGVGELSTGFCSDTLNINDGSSAQPAICGTNETYNFYKWTSPEVTAQAHSIFITYDLPNNFKSFVPSSTSLMGRTDSSDAGVVYHIYKNTNSGLVACGSATTVSTGSKSSWQKANATGGADPANCNFSSSRRMVIRIDLSASNDANAYVSNLAFAYSII